MHPALIPSSLMPSWKNWIRGKICLVTLRTILGTHKVFHMFRKEFEHANRHHFLIIAIDSEDGNVIMEISYTYICLLFLPPCRFNYTN